MLQLGQDKTLLIPYWEKHITATGSEKELLKIKEDEKLIIKNYGKSDLQYIFF